MSFPGSTHPASLLKLPDELILQIISRLLHHDLASLCLVSRRLNAIADPVLYKSILFDQPRHHLLFSESLATRPRRGSLIQNVRVDYAGAGLGLEGDLMEAHPIDRFSHTISAMSNLEDLVIAVPENGGYWDLQDNIHIFGHPTLEDLTVRHAKLDERGFSSLEKPWCTGLKTLHLINCDVHDDALADLLVLPEALREITITQLSEPSPALEESPEYMEDYILACLSAQHSLERIVIDFPSLAGKNPLKMRDFDRLRMVGVRDHQLFGMKTPRLHSVALPPNLEVLDLLDGVGRDEEVMELLCYMLENKDVFARRWTELRIGGDGGVPEKVRATCAAFEGFLNIR
ncbi:F-box domain-containing protein [Diplocarpon rosae]|nr:F-box domain-containing protein [Diplocarpon rosae]